MLMGGGDPCDPARMAEVLKSLYIAGIDAGRAIRDAEAKRDGEAAFGAGFKQGFDEGKKQSGETIARMANELLTHRQEHGRNLCKKVSNLRKPHKTPH